MDRFLRALTWFWLGVATGYFLPPVLVFLLNLN
jgi:hypothetical protein